LGPPGRLAFDAPGSREAPDAAAWVVAACDAISRGFFARGPYCRIAILYPGIDVPIRA
jgi:hypothetical protein